LKVAEVVSDDERGRCRHCEFEDKIVIGIGQEWSPREKYLLVIGQPAKAIDDSAQVFTGEIRDEPRPEHDRLIFKNECDGHGNSDVSGADCPEDLETCTLVGSECCHKN
jgi:hypothetical protein